MYLQRSSPAGVRLLSSLRVGGSLKKSARATGVGKETARRWVHESFVEMRNAGMSVAEAQSLLGFVSSLMPAWDAGRLASGGPRHHLRHPSEVEAAFWSAHQGGAPVATASGVAGVGRSTGYRWLQARFTHLRQDRVSVAAVARVLRLDDDRAVAWEAERRRSARKPRGLPGRLTAVRWWARWRTRR